MSNKKNPPPNVYLCAGCSVVILKAPGLCSSCQEMFKQKPGKSK